MKRFITELCVCLSILTITLALDYKPRYQPELDQLSLENYITSERLFNLHINCLFFDGPCDSAIGTNSNAIGRWMKPRMASYLLGTCILCTPNQEKEADKFMTWLYEYHPQLFRMGITKYLDANGITLPKDSKFKELVQKMNVPKVESQETSGGLENVLQPEKQEQLQQEQGRPEPGIHQHLQQSQSFQQNNQPHQKQHQQLQLNEQQQQASFGNQRILNPNSRKHKFSAGMNTFTGVYKTSHISMEDDEAEMEVTTEH